MEQVVQTSGCIVYEQDQVLGPPSGLALGQGMAVDEGPRNHTTV